MSPQDYYDPSLDRFTAPPPPAAHTPEGIAFNMQQRSTGELNSLMKERAGMPRKAVLTCGLILGAGCSIVGFITNYVMTHQQEFPGLFLK